MLSHSKYKKTGRNTGPNGERKFKRFTPGMMKRKCDDPNDPVDYKNLTLIHRYLTPQGKLQSRKRTKYCAQCQREIVAAIKRARFLGLLPYVA